MIDVAEAIDAEAENVSYRSVTAASGVWNTAGEWEPNAATVAVIEAAIQPAKGTALMDMPEGIRNEAEWLGWSRTAVVTNDEINHNGVWYRVIFIWPRKVDVFTRFALGRMK